MQTLLKKLKLVHGAIPKTRSAWLCSPFAMSRFLDHSTPGQRQYVSSNFGVQHVFAMKRNGDAIIISSIDPVASFRANEDKTSPKQATFGFFRIEPLLLR